MKNFFQDKKGLLIVGLFAGILFFGYIFNGGVSNSPQVVPISEFVTMVKNGKISSVDMSPESLVALNTEGGKVVVFYPMFYSPKIIEDMVARGLKVNYVGGSHDKSAFQKILIVLGNILTWLPLIFIAWLWFGMFKGMGGGKNDKNNSGSGGGGGMFGSGAFGFGKSKARMLVGGKDIKVKFNDIAGIDEAKEELQEVVDFLRNPQKYQEIGGRIPKGCLLIGQPGTGKTLLAKAISCEAEVPFFFISGSDFVEMFVGVGASRVRDMFGQAKKHAPCIIFIDEIDAVGRQRGAGLGGGNDEREQTLNQMLVEMDGFEENSGIVVVAATNRPDVLDNALLRPGRFDRQITIDLPDIKGREEILKIHIKKIKISPSVDVKTLARGTPGFSGADLANIVNESALLAARRGKLIVTSEEFEEARDKILMGTARKTIMKDEEKRLTAYHEGGHALASINMPGSDPIHKATIIPRGRALGVVIRLPESDVFSMTRQKMYADLVVGMAGRVAEEIIFGEDKVTSGASSDIQQVTKLARAMVIKWGMSDKIGMINYGGDSNDFYASSKDKTYNASEKTSELIDSEVKSILDWSYSKAKEILNEKIDSLHAIAKALLEFETLTGEEIKDIVAGKFEKKAPSVSSEASVNVSGVGLSSINKDSKKQD